MSSKRRKRARSNAIDAGPAVDHSPPGIVWLNVGGREYVTTESTLRAVSDSMMATLISAQVPSATVNGAYYIDRDPDLFAYVLEYLRTSTVELPSSEALLRRLEREAEFFMLPGLRHHVRSKLLERVVEVKFYHQPFGCSDDACRCGGGGVRRDAYTEEELDAMDDVYDSELKHPEPRPECELSFGVPQGIVRVQLGTEVPRSPEDSRIEVSLAHRAEQTLAAIMSMTSEQQFAQEYGDCGCNGQYKVDGVHNRRAKYKNGKGAIIYFSGGQWRANKEDNADSFVFSIASSELSPPAGKWAGDRGGWCLVEGEDHFRPERTSMEEALTAVSKEMREFPASIGDREELLKRVVLIFKDLVEHRRRSSRRVMFAKVGSYHVGDEYCKKDQRQHFQGGIKLEFDVLNVSHGER